MKAFLVVVLCFFCSLVSYLVGHAKGHSYGARLELTSSLTFLTVARAKIEDGNTAGAVEAIDKGLDASSDTIMNLERSSSAGARIGAAIRPGKGEQDMANIRKMLAENIHRMRTPVPAKMYELLNLPVVQGNSLPPSNGNPLAVPPAEGGQNPAPAPAPKQPALPPGLERRQR